MNGKFFAYGLNVRDKKIFWQKLLYNLALFQIFKMIRNDDSYEQEDKEYEDWADRNTWDRDKHSTTWDERSPFSNDPKDGPPPGYFDRKDRRR